MKLLKLVASSSCIIIIWVLMIGLAVESSHMVYPEHQTLEATNVKQVYRTGFHFQPPKHWINDPNGPMYWKGIYHLFYQYNPKGAVWGNIVWAHSVSKDLITWDALEPAIYPSKPFDENGCWSGSATILPGNKPVILYTGLDPHNRQVQNIAYPANHSDPYLREWVKPDYNPIIQPSPGMNTSLFRDPTTAWWTKGHWKIIVGGRWKKHKGVAWLYRSKDFKTWIKARHPLHSAPHTGMWECPDFYPVGENGLRSGLDTLRVGPNVKHVLKVSLDETRFEYYTIGTYDLDKDRYTPDNTTVDGWAGLRYDYGNFYASKTFYDSKHHRRILWGWSNESSVPNEDIQKGWAGIQAIPRSVWLDRNGKQLLQWPIKGVEKLRKDKVDVSKLGLNQGAQVEIHGITPAQADVEVTFSFESLDKAEPFDPSWTGMDAQTVCGLKRSTVLGGLGPFGLLTLASEDLEEYTPVFFRIFKAQDSKHVVLMCADASSSSLDPLPYKPSFAGFVDVDLHNKKLSLRTLIDHSVVESFGEGGKTVITTRVYPTKARREDAHLFVFNNGIEPITIRRLKAWSMRRPLRMNNNMHY